MGHRYYPALDGIRTIAVLIVLCAHAGLSFPKSGGVGVDIFFVLSGFLITSILSAEFARFRSISFKNFYVRRFLRLNPCLTLTTIFFFLSWIACGKPAPIQTSIISLTYVANWARAIWQLPLTGMEHCWSLAIEEQYYLFWPIVITLLERSVKSSSIKSTILLVAAFGLAGYRFAMANTFSAFRINFGLDTHMDGLILGSSLAYGVDVVTRNRDRWIARWSSVEIVLSYVLVPASIAGMLVVMKLLMWWDARMWRFGFFAVAAAAYFIIADIVLSRKSLVRRPLEWAPPVYLGRISYGIYLYHLPLFLLIDDQLPELGEPAQLALKFGGSILLAAASYHLIETKFLNLKKYFVKHEIAAGRPEKSS